TGVEDRFRALAHTARSRELGAVAKPGVVRVQQLEAFACERFQRLAIPQLDPAAAIADRAQHPQAPRRVGDALAAHAEQVGQRRVVDPPYTCAAGSLQPTAGVRPVCPGAWIRAAGAA